MVHSANQISSIVRVIGLMLVAVAIMLVPFGSSSVALASAAGAQTAHAAPIEIVIVHDVDHHADIHQAAEPDLDQTSNDHERDACCDGFCIGSAALSSASAGLVHPGLAKNPVNLHASLEPGEWVPPFRPPNGMN